MDEAETRHSVRKDGSTVRKALVLRISVKILNSMRLCIANWKTAPSGDQKDIKTDNEPFKILPKIATQSQRNTL